MWKLFSGRYLEFLLTQTLQTSCDDWSYWGHDPYSFWDQLNGQGDSEHCFCSIPFTPNFCDYDVGVTCNIFFKKASSWYVFFWKFFVPVIFKTCLFTGQMISCCCLEDDELKEKIINLKDVLQALLGSWSLPRNISSGLLTFDHSNNRLSSVNTCGPSITFSSIDKIRNFEEMKNHMLSIVIEAREFGLE